MCEQYMGWTNRETFMVDDWAQDAQAWRDTMVTEWVRRDLSGRDLEHAAIDWFEEFLKSLSCERREKALRGVGSLSRVNWTEIVNRWISDWWQNERDRQFMKDHYDESNISGIVGGDE